MGGTNTPEAEPQRGLAAHPPSILRLTQTPQDISPRVREQEGLETLPAPARPPQAQLPGEPGCRHGNVGARQVGHLWEEPLPDSPSSAGTSAPQPSPQWEALDSRGGRRDWVATHTVCFLTSHPGQGRPGKEAATRRQHSSAAAQLGSRAKPQRQEVPMHMPGLALQISSPGTSKGQCDNSMAHSP